jgi:methyl acetate hydrolase
MPHAGAQSNRWAGLERPLEQAVRAGAVPGAAAAVTGPDGTLHEVRAGVVQAGAGEPVSEATMFRFASMSKPLTSVAALHLIERGQLGLEQEVASVLPEFGQLPVLEGFDGDVPRLRPPTRQAVVRELLNHTSGVSYFFTNADILRYHQLTGLTTDDGILESLKAPLASDPGTRWEYGVGSDYLGLVVEAVSGQDLDAYLREHVFGPLDMRDATFAPSAEQRARLMPVHYREADGALLAGEDILALEPEFYSGGGGAYGTVHDYGRFAAALLGGGELDGARILAPDTVRLMFEGSLGELELPDAIYSSDPTLTNDVPFPPVEQDFGLGLNVMLEDLPGGRRAGSAGWSGIFNTHFWVDPAAGIAATLMTQVLPCCEPQVAAMAVAFEEVLYSLLDAGGGTPGPA